MFRTLTLGDHVSVALRKLLQGGRRGKLGYIQVCNKGSRQAEHQRSDIRLRSLAFYVWEDASLWTHWVYSFHMHLNYLSGANPVSVITLRSGRWLHSPSSSAITVGGGSIHWISVWEPSFTFGGQTSLMAVTFLVYWYDRRYCHFTSCNNLIMETNPKGIIYNWITLLYTWKEHSIVNQLYFHNNNKSLFESNSDSRCLQKSSHHQKQLVPHFPPCFCKNLELCRQEGLFLLGRVS